MKAVVCWYWCGLAVVFKQVNTPLQANVLKMECSWPLSRFITRTLIKVKVIGNPDWKTNLSVQRKSCSNHRDVNSYLQHLHEPLQSDSKSFEVILTARQKNHATVGLILKGWTSQSFHKHHGKITGLFLLFVFRKKENPGLHIYQRRYDGDPRTRGKKKSHFAVL